jgi:hypothetical protein
LTKSSKLKSFRLDHHRASLARALRGGGTMPATPIARTTGAR